MKKAVRLSRIMSKAWQLAREGVKRFGGQSGIYFASALTIAWEMEKKSPPMLEEPRSSWTRAGNRFLLPGVPCPSAPEKKGQLGLPGIGQ